MSFAISDINRRWATLNSSSSMCSVVAVVIGLNELCDIGYQ